MDTALARLPRPVRLAPLRLRFLLPLAPGSVHPGPLRRRRAHARCASPAARLPTVSRFVSSRVVLARLCSSSPRSLPSLLLVSGSVCGGLGAGACLLRFGLGGRALCCCAWSLFWGGVSLVGGGCVVVFLSSGLDLWAGGGGGGVVWWGFCVGFFLCFGVFWCGFGGLCFCFVGLVGVGLLIFLLVRGAACKLPPAFWGCCPLWNRPAGDSPRRRHRRAEVPMPVIDRSPTARRRRSQGGRFRLRLVGAGKVGTVR